MSTMFNETTYLGSLGDYVKGGDAIYYAATVVAQPSMATGSPLFSILGGSGSFESAASTVASGISGNGFRITKQEIVPGGNSIAFDAIAPGDFGDSNDIKALFDGIVQSSGFQLKASHIEHRALNLAGPGTLDPTLGKGIFQIAGEWWTQATKDVAGGFAKGIADQLGIPQELVIGGGLILGAILVVSLIKR